MRRTAVFAVSRPGGRCSSGFWNDAIAAAGCEMSNEVRERTRAGRKSMAGETVASCGVVSERASVRQQPIFAISAHWLTPPACIDLQQALSSRVMASPVTQASIGARVVSTRSRAAMEARRRIVPIQYRRFCAVSLELMPERY
jgi:hypothetical protein